MKLSLQYSLFLMLMIPALLTSCGESAEERADRELRELNNWVQTREPLVETASEEEWKRIDADFNNRADELEKRKEDMSDSSQKAFEKLRIKFYDWGSRNKQYQEIKRQKMEQPLVPEEPDTASLQQNP